MLPDESNPLVFAGGLNEPPLVSIARRSPDGAYLERTSTRRQCASGVGQNVPEVDDTLRERVCDRPDCEKPPGPMGTTGCAEFEIPK
jgi:hypothetical protein